MEKKILIVCTGNTCRSPMAEGILEKMAEERGLLLDVFSAGTAANEGDEAAEQAVEVLKEKEIDLSGHQAKPLNEEMIKEADLILVMTERHREAVRLLIPQAEEKIRLLHMEDPFGQTVKVYRRCAEKLEKDLAGILSELEKEENGSSRKKGT